MNFFYTEIRFETINDTTVRNTPKFYQFYEFKPLYNHFNLVACWAKKKKVQRNKRNGKTIEKRRKNRNDKMLCNSGMKYIVIKLNHHPCMYNVCSQGNNLAGAMFAATLYEWINNPFRNVRASCSTVSIKHYYHFDRFHHHVRVHSIIRSFIHSCSYFFFLHFCACMFSSHGFFAKCASCRFHLFQYSTHAPKWRYYMAFVFAIAFYFDHHRGVHGNAKIFSEQNRKLHVNATISF